MVLEFKGRVPLSKQFDDLYFSQHGGWAEKDYVFVQGNNLPARFAPATTFTIAELGFGTGLSFLAALQAWRQHAPATARLDFFSIEGYPLNRADMAAALEAQDVPEDLVEALLADWPVNTPHEDVVIEFGRVRLVVLVGDIATKLGELPEEGDAWFLDGFSPAKNSAMWSETVWQTLREKSAPGATAATYSCAKVVREGLTLAGFTWQKIKGYSHKDGMLTAVKK